MTRRLLGPVGGPILFFVVGALVFGVLGWVTYAALRVEQAQREAAARAELGNHLRVALWRLDGRMLPALGVEDSRPYYHYDPPAGFGPATPLLAAPLPEWMRLHFQVDPAAGWASPQVLPVEVAERVRNVWPEVQWRNLNGTRADYLDNDLKGKFPFRATCDTFAARDRAIPADSLPLAAPLFTEVLTPPVDEPAPVAPSQPPAASTPKPPPPQDPISNTHQPGPDPATDTLRVLGFELCLRPDQPALDNNLRAENNSNAQKKAVGNTVGQDAPPPRPAQVQSPANTNYATRGGGRTTQKDAENERQLADFRNRAETIDKAMKEAKLAGQSAEYPFPLSRAPFLPPIQNYGPVPLQNDQKALGQQQLPGVKNDANSYGTYPTTPPVVPVMPTGPSMPPAAPGAAVPPVDGSKSKTANPNDAKALDELAKREQDRQDALKAAERDSTKLADAANDMARRFGWLAPLFDQPKRRAADELRKTQEQGPADKQAPGAEKAAGTAGGMTPPVPPTPGEDRPTPPAVVAVPTPVVAPVQPFAIHLGSMRPQWVTAPDGSEMLVLVRTAKLDDKTVYQGVVLDWPKLEAALKDEVKDLFPDARLVPVKDPEGVSPDRAMTALPVQLDPGPEAALPPAGWTPLRFGLALAWVAALISFVAVGFSGWSLIDLAERRIRFVSAVTHELRTPLTSLRLYLDLLVSGMVQDEAKRQEYLNTLATESDRLHRLIDNVLDFAKLEKRRRNGDVKPVKVTDLVEQVRGTWADRVAQDGKELVVISTLPADREVRTDAAMIQQIVGNLIDNARKYTRDAADQRIWLWAKPGTGNAIVLEVEDRGPGVPANERRSVFKPFRRGEHADSTAGGAGLGLALAKSWAEVLGAKLTYRPADGGTGACFRLELPGK